MSGQRSGSGYGVDVARQFELARRVFPAEILAVWAAFRDELKARANGEDVRVAKSGSSTRLGYALTIIQLIPSGSVEFAENPSLAAAAERAAGLGQLSFSRVGGKIVLVGPSSCV